MSKISSSAHSPSANAEQPQDSLGSKEFIILMGILMALIALCIDAMLPTLDRIATDLHAPHPNDGQKIISYVFWGMALGVLFYGPLSDCYGRKKCIYSGLVIFIIGSVISMLAVSFPMMLAGRVLQGIGAAAPRVLTVAMVRDKYHGQMMARVMALLMMVFVIVPALAPALGQLIVLFMPWRVIFAFFVILGMIGFVWFAWRQEETLHPEYKKTLNLSVMIQEIIEVVTHPITRNYSITSGLLFGAFVGYLVSSQQILQIQYGLGVYFPFYFGILAIIFGASSFINNRLLIRWSVERVSLYYLILMNVAVILFAPYALIEHGHPPLFAFMVYLGLVFFFCGALFANLTTLAIRPMAHIAGMATSCITAFQTALCTLLGSMIGYAYQGTIMPLVIGFVLMCLLALAVFVRTYLKA